MLAGPTQTTKCAVTKPHDYGNVQLPLTLPNNSPVPACQLPRVPAPWKFQVKAQSAVRACDRPGRHGPRKRGALAPEPRDGLAHADRRILVPLHRVHVWQRSAGLRAR